MYALGISAFFHDHRICNVNEYQLFFNHIENHIVNWNKDKFFKKQNQ